MDPLSVFANCFALLEVTKGIFRHAQALRSQEQEELLARTYGRFSALLTCRFLPETASRYETIYRHVIQGTKEAAMSFRQATTDECNMTAVAGAIIGQVSITALSLPFLSNTHWTARACFLLATTSGCLSVYYACKLQRIVGELYDADQIREWLMVPDREESFGDGSQIVQAGSLAAVFILSAPFVMVEVSIFSFLLGLAIYQGFVFTKNLDNDTSPSDSRNNFVALMVGTGLFLVYFVVTFSLKEIASTIRSVSSRETASDPTPQDSKVEGNLSRRTDPADMLHDRKQSGEQQETNSPQTYNLAALLEAAAQAHAQCAEADRRVATALSASATI